MKIALILLICLSVTLCVPHLSLVNIKSIEGGKLEKDITKQLKQYYDLVDEAFLKNEKACSKALSEFEKIGCQQLNLFEDKAAFYVDQNIKLTNMKESFQENNKTITQLEEKEKRFKEIDAKIQQNFKIIANKSQTFQKMVAKISDVADFQELKSFIQLMEEPSIVQDQGQQEIEDEPPVESEKDKEQDQQLEEDIIEQKLFKDLPLEAPQKDSKDDKKPPKIDEITSEVKQQQKKIQQKLNFDIIEDNIQVNTGSISNILNINDAIGSINKAYNKISKQEITKFTHQKNVTTNLNKFLAENIKKKTELISKNEKKLKDIEEKLQKCEKQFLLIDEKCSLAQKYDNMVNNFLNVLKIKDKASGEDQIPPLVPPPPLSDDTMPSLPPSDNAMPPLPPSDDTMPPLPPSDDKIPPLPPSDDTMPPLPPSYDTMPPLPPSDDTMPPLPPSDDTMPPLPSSDDTMPPLPPSDETGIDEDSLPPGETIIDQDQVPPSSDQTIIDYDLPPNETIIDQDQVPPPQDESEIDYELGFPTKKHPKKPEEPKKEVVEPKEPIQKEVENLEDETKFSPDKTEENVETANDLYEEPPQTEQEVPKEKSFEVVPSVNDLDVEYEDSNGENVEVLIQQQDDIKEKPIVKVVDPLALVQQYKKQKLNIRTNQRQH